MTFSDLFDAKLHFLDPEEDFQIPWLICEDIVVTELQPKDLDPLESPSVNLVTVEAEERIQMFWKVDEGWSAFSNIVQVIGKALGGSVQAVKTNHWDEGNDPFGPADEVEFKMRDVPGDEGWEGGTL